MEFIIRKRGCIVRRMLDLARIGERACEDIRLVSLIYELGVWNCRRAQTVHLWPNRGKAKYTSWGKWAPIAARSRVDSG